MKRIEGTKIAIMLTLTLMLCCLAVLASNQPTRIVRKRPTLPDATDDIRTHESRHQATRKGPRVKLVSTGDDASRWVRSQHPDDQDPTYSGRQIVSLIELGEIELGYTPESPSTSRQIVDLSNFEPTDDDVSGSSEEPSDQSLNEMFSSASPRIERITIRLDETPGWARPGSDSWVDWAIPPNYFEDAGITPQTDELPDQDRAEISAGQESNGNPPASEKHPREADRPQDSSQHSIVETDRTKPIPSQSKSSSTYSPDQAIPDWILQEAGQLPTPTERVWELPSPPELILPEPTQSESSGSESIQPVPEPLEIPPGNAPSMTIDKGAGNLASPKSTGTEEVPSDKVKENTPHQSLAIEHSEHFPARIDAYAQKTDYFGDDFSPPGGPMDSTFDPLAASEVYRGKFSVPVQRPLIELWRPLYTSGIYPPALTWFGATNPMKPHFMVYGDMRSVVGVNQNAGGKSNLWGNVLNLDMDLQLTSTERIHAFVSPLNKATQATGLSFNDDVDFIDAANFDFVTLFFEGDVGALTGGATGRYPPFDLPFTFGLIPLVYQNGIWANDAVLGAAVALPARHHRWLKWSNYDATFFWATDNITTDAFPGQDSAADFFGTAWFIDAYEGYIEADYAFVNDNTGGGRSYHNVALAFTRRYLARLSNSIRFIANVGQDNLSKADRTADGHLLLIENSLITAYPNTVVPYMNFFYGQGRPQSLARAGLAGGVLNNTGINFETDGITGYPTLDATGHNTFGFAAGVNLLGSQFSHQLILETAMLKATGSPQRRNAEGDQYALGLRYQKPLSHNLIFRTDHMLGWRESASNLNGSRFELRWKF